MSNLIRAGALALAVLAAAAASAQSVSKPPADDPVVARVNDSEIRRSDVLITIESLPAQYRQLPLEALFGTVLTQMIDRRLIAQAAEKSKLGDDAEVKRRLAGLRERVLQEIYLSNELEKALTDDKVRSRHEQLLKSQPAKEEVRARHILLASEADAKAVIDELTKGGDFAELAKSRSSGPSAATGGDLGYFAKDQMVPEFAEAAFAMKKGETSKAPVKTQFGWHVIKIEDRRQAAPPSFEERKDELRREMAQEMIVAIIDDLRKGAKIEQFSLDGGPAPADGAKPAEGKKQ
jgi:peptidyl-prolyl cis-trans isomerase C